MRYVALLRGIGPGNPAQRNENLRAVLTGLGFSDVRSVISSGNLVFDVPPGSAYAELEPAGLETVIEEQWPAQLGFVSGTFVRSAEEFRKLAAVTWFGERPDDRSGRLQVTFLKAPTPPGTLESFPDQPGMELIRASGRHIAWGYDQDQVPGAKAMAWFDRSFAKHNTTRTWRTVQRIATRLG